jgi:hypothetical protein
VTTAPCSLGALLDDKKGDYDGAESCYRDAIDCDEACAPAHYRCFYILCSTYMCLCACSLQVLLYIMQYLHVPVRLLTTGAFIYYAALTSHVLVVVLGSLTRRLLAGALQALQEVRLLLLLY